MLAQTLRTLEADGLVHREQQPVMPPRVDYSLTPLGEEPRRGARPAAALGRPQRRRHHRAGHRGDRPEDGGLTASAAYFGGAGTRHATGAALLPEKSTAYRLRVTRAGQVQDVAGHRLLRRPRPGLGVLDLLAAGERSPDVAAAGVAQVDVGVGVHGVGGVEPVEAVLVLPLRVRPGAARLGHGAARVGGLGAGDARRGGVDDPDGAGAGAGVAGGVGGGAGRRRGAERELRSGRRDAGRRERTVDVVDRARVVRHDGAGRAGRLDRPALHRDDRRGHVLDRDVDGLHELRTRHGAVDREGDRAGDRLALGCVRGQGDGLVVGDRPPAGDARRRGGRQGGAHARVAGDAVRDRGRQVLQAG
ncbi:helix-turn-helix domain-containing protein [Nocardioides convexus]|uniref:winged helix-turn-helix transcriptional regulator n=1 Tax=Nocardioides convexus TaxID=2712224 RepID=UPI003100A9B5